MGSDPDGCIGYKFIFPMSQNTTVEGNEFQNAHDCFIGNATIYYIGILCAKGSPEQIELLELDRATIRVAEYLTELSPRELFEEKLHAAIRRAREQLERRGDGEAIKKNMEELGYGG